MAKLMKSKKTVSVDVGGFEELIKIERKLKELTAKREELRAELLPVTQRLEEVVVGNYKFSTQRRSSYTYSSSVFELEAQLKARKRYEEQEGIAKPKAPTVFITMKEVKA